MGWGIYSPEDFPKWDEENNCMADYRQSLGVQVVLKAGAWAELEDFYKQTRWESWVEASGDGRESVISGKQVAERMVGDFRLRGIRCANLDKISDEQKKAIEEDGNAQNLKFRKMFVTRFEEQFRVKTNGGPGRFTPNAYELECYKMLGMEPPQVVQRIPQQPQAAPVIIQQNVDPEMLAQLVAAEVARITADKKPSKVI